MIDFDVIFPIQSSEFIKSLNFGSVLKKLQKKHTLLSFFIQKLIFIAMKHLFLISEIGYDLIDLT